MFSEKKNFQNLKVQSCKLHNNKYDSFNKNNKHWSFCVHCCSSFFFKLLNCKVLFINRKDQIKVEVSPSSNQTFEWIEN